MVSNQKFFSLWSHQQHNHLEPQSNPTKTGVHSGYILSLFGILFGGFISKVTRTTKLRLETVLSVLRCLYDLCNIIVFVSAFSFAVQGLKLFRFNHSTSRPLTLLAHAAKLRLEAEPLGYFQHCHNVVPNV